MKPDLEKDPGALEELSLDELLDAIRALPAFSERHAEILDFLHRQRALDALAGSPDPDELQELVHYFDRLLDPVRSGAFEALSRSYASRWEALSDLVDDRLRRLETTEGSQLDEFLRRNHVRTILDVLAEAERQGRTVSQAELGASLRLRKANLTRVLNLMTARDLVVRRRKGRSNEVGIGEAARRLLPSREPPSGDARRAVLYLVRGPALRPCNAG